MEQTRKLYFSFPDISAGNDFSFEKLTTENFAQLYLMFENDESPFTDKRFMLYQTAEKYAAEMDEYGRSSPKHGAQDWLFRYKNSYAGVLHLYDMSLETFAENNRRCWIGFATRSAMRRQGITRKAARCFIQYIFNSYPQINCIHAMTLQNNIPSQNLLRSLHFLQDFEERLSKAHNFYLLTKEEYQK